MRLAAAALLAGSLAASALGASGLRKRGSEEAATAADLWHLGSCTKAMTATLAARLVEAGRIGWDTRVADALPALAAKIHSDFRGATLGQLLAHRGGAPNDYEKLPIGSWLWSSRAEPREARSRFAAAILEAARSMRREAPTSTPTRAT